MAEKHDAWTQTTILGDQLDRNAPQPPRRTRLPLPTCPKAASCTIYGQMTRESCGDPALIGLPPLPASIPPTRPKPASYYRQGSATLQSRVATPGPGNRPLVKKKMCKNKKPITLADFSVVARLGSGGFGEVFLVAAAANNSLGVCEDMVMALKQAPKKRARQKLGGRVAYIYTEKSILTELRGAPFCLWLIGTFQTRHYVYHLTEFYPGGTLMDHIHRTLVLDLNSFRTLAAELVCAVGYLHEKGIVHRDIKASNIAIDEEGHIVLLDFGMSYYKRDIYYSGRRPGSYSYCSPEFFERKLGYKYVDWWSVGVTLLFTLTWNNPFAEGMSSDMNTSQLWKVVHENVLNFNIKKHLMNVDFPINIKRLLQDLLEKDSKKRLGAKNGFKSIKKHAFFCCPAKVEFIDRTTKTVSGRNGKVRKMNCLVKRTVDEREHAPLDWEQLAARRLAPPFPGAEAYWTAATSQDLEADMTSDENAGGHRNVFHFKHLNTGPYIPKCT